jgi:hypothetical protein
MLCSIVSFNEKRGRPAFGLHAGDDLESYVTDVLAPSVADLLREWRARSGESFLVRYEDLVTNPRETMIGVLGHAGLASGPADVEAILARAADRPAGMEQHRTATGPEESIGRWARDLDPALQRLCEDAFGEALAEFGYDAAPAAGRAI